MVTNTTVRQMNKDDYNQVNKIDIMTQRQYLREKFDQMSEEEQNKHLVSNRDEFQINVTTGYCFVAETEGLIVGFILAHETLPFHGTLLIRYIGINPDIQGKGVGLLLYKKLIDKAKQMGIKEIRALINTDNPNSVKLCEKAGFRISDRKEALLKIVTYG